MTGNLTYNSVAEHRSELLAAATRDRRAPRKPRRERRRIVLRRPRRAYA